jgi:hypothetical protein
MVPRCYASLAKQCLGHIMRLFPSSLRSQQQPNSTRRQFRRGFEGLENRSLLAADLSVDSFTADGVNLVVDYSIAQQMATEFSIAIYRSFDGVSQDQLLLTQPVFSGWGVGSHQVTIPAAFSEFMEDYQLIAVIDSAAEITESDETNNQAVFAGGVFVDDDGVLQVHGTEDADYVSVYVDGYLQLDFNSVTYAYLETEVAGISIRTHAGDDWVLADAYLAQDLLVYGGADNDVLLGGAGNDTFFGGAGSDYLIGGSGGDSLYGEAGDDYLSGDDGDDLLEGGDGYDAVYGGAGADTLGDSTADPYAWGYGDILEAGEGDDIIYGTGGDDVINGGAGNDTIYGLGGNDQLFGDEGNDYLDGGEGDDFLYGGAGSDTLYGRGGYDSLFGEDGDDYLYGGSEDDYLVGGNDHDLHDPGSEAGDSVGDRPSFSNLSYTYSGALRRVSVSGCILDDEPFTNLCVYYSGAAEGTISLSETGTFAYFIEVPEFPSKWLYLDFTDAEGLQAQRMIITLT